jgi:hypothetical protein
MGEGHMTSPKFAAAIPLLRIFDEGLAFGFYQDWLGFRPDWEHRFHPGAPPYAQISRAGLVLHLTAHHGDATPGSTVSVPMNGIDALHDELLNQHPNPYMRPALETLPWGRQIEVTDPFGNRLRFCEYVS